MPIKMLSKVRKFLKETDGPTAVEYAVMLALIIGMMMAAISFVGEQTRGTAQDVADGLDNALNN